MDARRSGSQGTWSLCSSVRVAADPTNTLRLASNSLTNASTSTSAPGDSVVTACTAISTVCLSLCSSGGIGPSSRPSAMILALSKSLNSHLLQQVPYRRFHQFEPVSDDLGHHQPRQGILMG